MPSLLLANERELTQLQDPTLAGEARRLHDAMAAAHKKIAVANAEARSMNGRTVREFTLEELRWGFALVASRAVASPVGDGASAAAIMVPFFDMANHDDASAVSAIKSVRGTEDGDVDMEQLVQAVRKAERLETLQVDYLDLVLIHCARAAPPPLLRARPQLAQ